MPQQPIRITHLSQIADKYRLDLYCKNCDRHVKVDIPEIIETRGDMEINAVARRFRCTECGHRGAQLRMSYVMPKG